MKRPLIGVTGPDRGGLAAWLFTRLAVARAGGRAVRITPGRDHPVDRLDGLIIGGGADVDPNLYGEDPAEFMAEIKASEPRLSQRLLGYLFYPLLWLIRRLLLIRTTGMDADRDGLEERLIRTALDRDLPLLGICRGMQLLNVVCGGTLHRNLKGFYTEHPQVRSVLPRKTVEIDPASDLARCLGTDPCRVNALHDQAVDRLGRGLRSVAREASGVIQAIEYHDNGDRDARFVVGVQWHPEFLPQKKRQQALFRALIEVARKRRGMRSGLPAEQIGDSAGT